MEAQTVRGPELRLAGLPAQQVSEEGPDFQVFKPPFCLVVEKAPTPRLVFSRVQKQRDGLGDRTLQAPVELGNLLPLRPPISFGGD